MCIIMISRDGLDPSVARKARVYIDSYVDEILDDIARVNGTSRQRGHGMGDFFVANRQPAYQPQKGGGFGKFLGSLFRSVRPMFMPTLKTLGKHALSTSIAVVGDVARGHDWREAAKRRFSETGEEIVGEVQNKVQKLMTGSGVHHHFHHQSKKRPYSSDYEYAADFLEGRDVAGNEGEPSNKKRKMEAKLKLLSIKPPPGATAGNISNRKRSRSVSVKPSAEGEGCAPSKKRKKSKKSKSKPKSEKQKTPKSKKAKKPKSKKAKKSKSKESKKKNKTKKGKKKSKKSKNLET